jgi:hypothetical protein
LVSLKYSTRTSGNNNLAISIGVPKMNLI